MAQLYPTVLYVADSSEKEKNKKTLTLRKCYKQSGVWFRDGKTVNKVRTVYTGNGRVFCFKVSLSLCSFLC